DPDFVAREINGYNLATGKLMDKFGDLKADGTTSSGNWIYCNQYTEADGNKLKRRDNNDTSLNQIGLYSGWAWCWPMNRRIIYNRASVDMDGNPWDTEHPALRWTGSVWEGSWMLRVWHAFGGLRSRMVLCRRSTSRGRAPLRT
ncbi:MAG: hypothetical protein NTU41_03475, partial [Chloroflexi bacterium]|nr:hypothetical protein [Chloroflexota bacterium]